MLFVTPACVPGALLPLPPILLDVQMAETSSRPKLHPECPERFVTPRSCPAPVAGLRLTRHSRCARGFLPLPALPDSALGWGRLLLVTLLSALWQSIRGQFSTSFTLAHLLFALAQLHLPHILNPVFQVLDPPVLWPQAWGPHVK